MKTFFKFHCKDDSQTVARTASLALHYWYARFAPKIEKQLEIDGEPVEALPLPIAIFQSSNEIPGPYDPNFLMLVTSVIERNHGTSFNVPQELLSEVWYDDLPDTDNHDTVQQSQHPKILAYEATCKNILQWLAVHGDITKLSVVAAL